MRSFFAWLATLLANNNSSWLGQVLTGAGLSVVSMTVFNSFFEYYKNQALSEFGKLGPVSGLLGISGLDKSICIIIGAYMGALYIKQFAAGLRVIKK